jgi:hypothetical protein
MDVLDKVASGMLAWAALSLVVATGWSRFMCSVRRKEQQMRVVSQRQARRIQPKQVRHIRVA